jgi:hypothetical protein
MVNFEIEGKLLRKLVIEQQGTTRPFCEFVVETADKFRPQYIKFQLEKELIYLLDKFEEGQKVKVQFDLHGEELGGKVVTTLHAISLMGVKAFKYQSEIDRNDLLNCPPIEFREMQMHSYRFVFENPLHPNNFLPVHLIKPERVNSGKDLTSKCAGYGLSLFQSAQGAREFFRGWMEKTNGKYAKLVGDHLAATSLETDDGVGSSPALVNHSHFTFHEYEDVDLAKKVSHIEKI